MTTERNAKQLAMIKELRPYFRMLHALEEYGCDIEEGLKKGLIDRTLELLTQSSTIKPEKLDEKIKEAWGEIMDHLKNDIMEEHGIEKLYSFHWNPKEIFPLEELNQQNEGENLKIYEKALVEETVVEETVVEETVVEETVVEEPVVEETVVEETVVEETVVEELVVEETVVEETVVEEPVVEETDLTEVFEIADSLLPYQIGTGLLNWTWYLEMVTMSETSEGLIGLPNVLINLHNKKLITSKRDLLDTMLMSLHSEIDTNGIRQISALFEKLE